MKNKPIFKVPSYYKTFIAILNRSANSKTNLNNIRTAYKPIKTTQNVISDLEPKRITTANTGLAKVVVQCSADTFVVNQSLVLRINICGENRHLRKAPKRV